MAKPNHVSKEHQSSSMSAFSSPKRGWEPLGFSGAARPVQMRKASGVTGSAVMNHVEGRNAKNTTGLPDNLKAGVERLSGQSMDDVKVHYNSSRPKDLGALAYAQGSDIHVGPGQERHLSHEAWHVVQQKQGRVAPTSQVGDTPINDDAHLEREADTMGARAASLPITPNAHREPERGVSASSGPSKGPAQRVYAQAQYTSNNQQRTLSMDPKAVTWGGAPQNQRAQQDRDGQRAIMYETISTPGRAGALIASYQQLAPNAVWDVGLSLVLNSFFVPAQNNVYSPQGQNLNQTQQVPQNQQRAQVEQALDNARAQIVQNWQGPPIVVSTAAWERHFINNGPQNIVLEPAKANVPYARLRRHAGSNPGAATVRQELEQRQDATVWRKMGDDDMPMIDPNGQNPAMQDLSTIEEEVDGASAFVSFGYELTDQNLNAPLPGLIQKVYAKEMELRDAIAQLGAKTYPIEPNTYYKFSGEQVGTEAFNAMENVNVGGGGQIKEGLRLMSATQDAGYTVQKQFHATRIPTDSGGRNAQLIQLLTPSIQQAQNKEEPDVWVGGVEAVLKELDQSYFADGVWSTVAGELMDAQAIAGIQEAGDKLVADMRKEVAVEITTAIHGLWRTASRGW